MTNISIDDNILKDENSFDSDWLETEDGTQRSKKSLKSTPSFHEKF